MLLFCNRSQKTSFFACEKQKLTVRDEVERYDVICDLLQYRRTQKCLFVNSNAVEKYEILKLHIIQNMTLETLQTEFFSPPQLWFGNSNFPARF